MVPSYYPPNHHGEEVDHVDHGDDNEKLCGVDEDRKVNLADDDCV